MEQDPEFPRPFEGVDPTEAARERAEEDKALQEAMDRTAEAMAEDPLVRLRKRRSELKDELNNLNNELGEGRVDRAWLRRLPEWFWFPLHITNHVIQSQTAAKRTCGEPTIYHWQRHADLQSAGTNIVLGLLYLAMVLALLGMLV